MIFMKVVFEGKKFKVLSGEVLLPSGKSVWRDIIDFGRSVVILPIKDGSVFIIRQYRPAVGGWIYELPAGTLEEGEDPMECAKRELIEEIGYEAGNLKLLFKMYLSPGYSNEYMYSYLATELKYVGERPEYGEEISIVKKRFDEVVDMIREGLIEDAKTIATLLYYMTFYLRSG